MGNCSHQLTDNIIFFKISILIEKFLKVVKLNFTDIWNWIKTFKIFFLFTSYLFRYLQK